MKRIRVPVVLAALLLMGVCAPASAGNSDPLFINMTTDEPHRADMAITFGMNQMEKGHPLTIFLNDKGVLVGSKVNASKYAKHQKDLAALMSKGATVIACPMCMKHYLVKEENLLPGILVGNPDLTGGALFKENTQTLTW